MKKMNSHSKNDSINKMVIRGRGVTVPRKRRISRLGIKVKIKGSRSVGDERWNKNLGVTLDAKRVRIVCASGWSWEANSNLRDSR